MSKEAMFTLKLEPELREQFMAEAAAADRPASQIIREFMRDFIKRQQEARDHDNWFHDEMEQALREASDPATVLITDEDIAEKWRHQRAKLVKQANYRGQ
jgi:predicted transcriptional regulator